MVDKEVPLAAEVTVKALVNGKWETVQTLSPDTVEVDVSLGFNKHVEAAEPSVRKIAHTLSSFYTIEDLGMVTEDDTPSSQDVLEFAGRACYQSFHKPNANTRYQKDYLENIINQGHESVLEHGSATFYLTGVSRAFTHELIRHRHLSYSQLSQRFVDESDARVVVPPAIKELKDNGHPEAYNGLLSEFSRALSAYEELVKTLEAQGYKRKQAREAARSVLPNSAETRIVVTGNFRAWRDFLKKRLDPAADAEIRSVADLILEELLEIAPDVFRDIAG